VIKTSPAAALLVVLAWPSLALAQIPEAPAPEIAALYACGAIQDSSAQLACFNQATADIRTALEQGRLVAISRNQVETMQRESFGFRLPSIANLVGQSEGAGPEAIEATVQRIISGGGRAVFVFEDGQRWEQVEDRSTYNVRPGDRVTVRRAALGSFMLSGSRGGPPHRVRRQE